MNDIQRVNWMICGAIQQAQSDILKVWRVKPIRYSILAVLLIASLFYWVTSLWFIYAGIYVSIQHLASLVLVFAGAFGVFVWIINYLLSHKRKQ